MRLIAVLLGAMVAVTIASPMATEETQVEAREALEALKGIQKRCTSCYCGKQGCCDCTGPFYCNNCKNGGYGVGCKDGRIQCGCSATTCYCCA